MINVTPPNPSQCIRSGLRRDRPGFALVITLALMVLLTLLAVGLLSLSAVSLRTASQGQAISVARANARLGLMLAVGTLQRSLGPDRRVSAPAAVVIPSAKQPHLTGAWASWRWDPTKSASPNYGEKSGNFLGWLVSTPDPKAALNISFPAAESLGSTVELIGPLANCGIANSVRVAKIPVANTRSSGSLAWAVFDESTKAAIDLGDPDKKPLTGEDIAGRVAPNRFRADALDSAKLATLKTPLNLFTLETAVVPGGLANAADIRRRFHDFTTGARGLLTDTANGGLKTDLTSLLESPSFPAGSFPADTLYSTVAAGAPRWTYFYDHYRKYKLVTGASAGTPTYVPPASELEATSDGLDPSPRKERLLPVISKLQLVFSVVSHHAHIPERIAFMDKQGEPKGNDQHAVPHLVYEPVITLFNPYDVALELKKLRIRIWDPPVAFRFAKVMNGVENWYRDDMANGEFQGLARMNLANQRNSDARRWFTLCLTDGTSQAAGKTLRLQPGEVKVFSSRVESNWSWSLECADTWNPRAFFDPNPNTDLGNIDKRTFNRMGVEAVPGWDTRAGLQTDHMSYSGTRPPATLYPFEKLSGGPDGGFVSIRISDEIRTELKAQRTTRPNGLVPDFQVDVLAGNTADVNKDILRSYRFRFADPTAEIGEFPTKPVISRKYRVSDTLQEWTDQSIGGKKCLGMLEMTARTTRDPLDDSKAWVYNNPVVEGGEQTTSVVGAANQSYDLRLIELTGWTSFPIIEWDSTAGPGYGRGYFGASRSANEGVTNVPMCRVPLVPAASLGELIPSNLVASSLLPRTVHPFGNSRAHPLLAPAEIYRPLGGATALDHSYFLNDTLWDRYYFSALTAYSGGALASKRSRREVLQGVLSGSQSALNSRLVAAFSTEDATNLTTKLDGLSDAERAKQLAAHLLVSGPFNLNSASVDAWRAVLGALRDREVTAWRNRVTPNPEATPVVRMGLPLAGPRDSSNDVNVQGQIRWAGYRSLDDTQVEHLATAIVAEITKRGVADKAPPLTLAEFVNRRPGPAGGLHNLAGILQTAIDNSGVNAANHIRDSRLINVADIPNLRKTGVLNPATMNGYTGEGAPTILTQGDLLGALAAIATVRGDTFKIRAYGEATNDAGSVQASAWCEAVVQRVADFVDPVDEPATPIAKLTGRANEAFGRQFRIVSFRWLNPEEVR